MTAHVGIPNKPGSCSYYVSCIIQRGRRQPGSPHSPFSAPPHLRLERSAGALRTPLQPLCNRVRPAFPAPSRPGRLHGWQRSPPRARARGAPRAARRPRSRPAALSAARRAPPAPRTAACRRRPRRRARRRRPARPRCRGRNPWAPPPTPAGRRGAGARCRRALRAAPARRARTRSPPAGGLLGGGGGWLAAPSRARRRGGAAWWRGGHTSRAPRRVNTAGHGTSARSSTRIQGDVQVDVRGRVGAREAAAAEPPGVGLSGHGVGTTRLTSPHRSPAAQTRVRARPRGCEGSACTAGHTGRSGRSAPYGQGFRAAHPSQGAHGHGARAGCSSSRPRPRPAPRRRRSRPCPARLTDCASAVLMTGASQAHSRPLDSLPSRARNPVRRHARETTSSGGLRHSGGTPVATQDAQHADHM
jgi:hypothetical protein